MFNARSKIIKKDKEVMTTKF